MNLMKPATALFATPAVMLGLFPAPLWAAPFCVEEATTTGIQLALQSRRLTSTSLVQTYLSRINAYDKRGPRINSILELNPDALAIAAYLDSNRFRQNNQRKLLYGIPILLKDNIDTADKMHTSAGTLALANSIPLRDSFVAQKLREAGAVILGKANLTEYANFMTIGMPSGYSSRGGQVLNPYNLAVDTDGIPLVSPGGSSSGSAAAVAANLATVAIGTETSGSILSPANQNGVVGIKPTVGLISRAGIIPISSTQDTAGPLARTVKDAAIVLGALTGVDPRDPATNASKGKFYNDYTQFLNANGLKGARIGIPRDVYYSVSPNFTQERLDIMNAAIAKMKQLGATIVEADIPTARLVGGSETTTTVRQEDGEPPVPVSTVLVYDFKKDLNAYLASLGPNAPIKNLSEAIAFNRAYPQQTLRFGQDILLAADATSGTLTERKYAIARKLDILQSRTFGIDAYMHIYQLDAILFPANRGAGIAAKAGYPSILVPAGFTKDGTPYGVTFTGKAFSEPTLLKLAYAYEQATQLRRPPKSASQGCGNR